MAMHMARLRWTDPMKSSSMKAEAGAPNLRVEAYIEALPTHARSHIEALRDAIRDAAPDAVESFGYGMPAFALNGKPFIWYAAWKTHSSIYPVSDETRIALAAELRGHEVSGKATVRFRLDKPVPAALVGQLVKARIEELGK